MLEVGICKLITGNQGRKMTAVTIDEKVYMLTRKDSRKVTSIKCGDPVVIIDCDYKFTAEVSTDVNLIETVSNKLSETHNKLHLFGIKKYIKPDENCAVIILSVV